MGLWKMLFGTDLFGETSESGSLETRMEMGVNREVEDRKRQARDRRITEKALRLTISNRYGLSDLEKEALSFKK